MNVIYLRSTSIFNNARSTKTIRTFLKNNFGVIVLGWDRDGSVSDDCLFKENDNEAKIDFFKLKCSYAGGMKNILKMFLFQLFLLRKLVKYHKNYDVIHSCDFDTSIMTKFVAKIYNKKIVYDICDYYVDSHRVGKLKNLIERADIKMINFADVTIICTEQRKEQIKKANPKKLIVIHNAPNLNNISSKNIIQSKNNKFKVCYVGILQPGRLLLELVEEFKNHSEYEFHVGGFGAYQEKMKDLSEKYDNIFYYGTLKYDEVLALEKECDLLFATYTPISANHKYSAPNKVYEAMALGKPIIVCKNTGVDSLVVKEKLGVSIEYNAKEFFEVLKMISSKKILQNVDKLGGKLYEEKYSSEIMEKRLIAEYKQLEG